jgi:Cu(I)/Ag(I) efflux system membrane protein CusA/SilA
VMSRIAAPMLGGMVTAPLLSMLVIPAVYKLMRRREVGRAMAAGVVSVQPAPAQ